MAEKVPSKVLSYDLGGTKVAVGVVNSKGKVLEEIRMPVQIDRGKEALLNQLAQMGRELLRKYPGIRTVGIASAGPLDSVRGILLDPTNFKTGNKTWGKVPIARMLSAKLKLPVYLENDAAAAILAEHWVGVARGYKDAMILTLGTGLGTGVIINDKLVRAGRLLHPEAGHIIVNHDDTSGLCGCGNRGCAEAYLSGTGFGRMGREALGDPTLDAKRVTELARGGNKKALELFDRYADILAVAIHNYAVIFAPEIVVFTGSFAAASDLFLDQTRLRLELLLARRRIGVDLMPKLATSTLENQAGLVGGAFIAFNQAAPVRVTSPRSRKAAKRAKKK